MVSLQLKLAALQGIPEVVDGGKGGQQLPVKSRILTLCGGELLGEETRRAPTFYLSLLQDTPNVGVRSVSRQQQLSVWQGVCQWHPVLQGGLDGHEGLLHGGGPL